MSVEHPITFKSICPPGPSTRWSVGPSLRPLPITTNYFWRINVVFASLSLAKRSISLFHRRSCPPGHDWGCCVFNLVWLLSAFLASPPSKPQTCDSFEFLFHPFLPSIQLWSKLKRPWARSWLHLSLVFIGASGPSAISFTGASGTLVISFTGAIGLTNRN